MGHLTQYIALLRDVVVICLGGAGVWMLKKQLDLKQSEIDVRQATEEHLRALQAPALAQQLRDVSQIANQLAAEKQQLQDRISALSLKSAEAEATSERARLVGIAEGCLEGFFALYDIDSFLHENQGRIPLSVSVSIWKTITDKRRELWTAVGVALKGQRPELPNSKKAFSVKVPLATLSGATRLPGEPPKS